MRSSLLLGLLISTCVGGYIHLDSGPAAQAVEPWLRDSSSSSATQANAIERIPFARINNAAQENIRGVVERPSFFRRLPTQSFECDPDLFTLLVRYPEIIVNIWDLMGITKVEVTRIAPYVFRGNDGAGTICRAELLYGTSDVHVYFGNGTYSGNMAAREIDGRCVSVLHSTTGTNRAGQPVVTVSMDVFMKLDNLGADLLTRTLGPLVGKTADYNFVESAKFIAQLYELCRDDPAAAQQLAQRLNRVDPAVRGKFSQVATQIAANSKAIDAAQMQSLAAANPAAAAPTNVNPTTAAAEPSSARSVPAAMAPITPVAKQLPTAVATTVPPATFSSQSNATNLPANKSSRQGASANLSDGIVTPAKPARR